MSRAALIVLATLLAAAPARAQTVMRLSRAPVAPALRAPSAAHGAVQSTGASAFLVETAGGIGGSLAAVLIGKAVLSDTCGTEDLVCHLERAGMVVLLGTAGAATGT